MTVIDACKASAYVPVLVQEKAPSPLKDIAIYRLQRVEKALERLGAAVSRLEGAAAQVHVPDETESIGNQDDGQLNLLQTELDSVRADYDRLKVAATDVAARLDSTIEKLDGASLSTVDERSANADQGQR